MTATRPTPGSAGRPAFERMMPRGGGRAGLRPLAVIALLALLLAGCTGNDDKPSPGPTVQPPASGGPTASPGPTVGVTGAIGLAVVNGAVWAASTGDGSIVRIDPSTRTVSQRVPVGDTPLRLADDGALVWVSVFRSGHLVAVDTVSGKVAHDVDLKGGGPEGVAVGLGSVWVVRQDAAVLTRLTRAGQPLGEIKLGKQPRLVAIGQGYAWVSNFGDGTLTRVNAENNGARTSPKICTGPQGLAVRGGVVWVACTGSGEVVAVDEITMKVKGRARVTGEPDGLRISADIVWVACTEGPALVRVSLKPTAPAVLSRTKLGSAAPLNDRGNVDVVLDGQRAWISSPGANLVYVSPVG